MAKGTVVAKKAVSRKSGYLYYVDGDGNVRESKMNRKGGKRGRRVCSHKPAAKKAAPRKRKAAPKRKTSTKRRKTTKRRK